jgi:DNA-binding GntR family transcriptional regulator
LDETSLSEKYGISRTPVRELLRHLAGEGYVDIRANRGARVIPMNHETLRDFFLVAPVIYEAVGRLAVQHFTPAQMTELKECQERFRSAVLRRDPEMMVVENNRFHGIIGEMAGSGYLKPSLSRLLIDHARIGHIFYRPTDTSGEANLAKSCEHHDELIHAIAARDEAAVVRLTFEHWELSRRNMEMFIVPKRLKSAAWDELGKERVSESAADARSRKTVSPASIARKGRPSPKILEKLR